MVVEKGPRCEGGEATTLRGGGKGDQGRNVPFFRTSFSSTVVTNTLEFSCTGDGSTDTREKGERKERRKADATVKRG